MIWWKYTWPCICICVYAGVGWGREGGAPSHTDLLRPLLSSVDDRHRSDTHRGCTLTSQPPDHFIWLQCVREGEETWKISPKCLSSQSRSHVYINISATSNQNLHSNLSTQDVPKNRHRPKTNTSARQVKILTWVKMMELGYSSASRVKRLGWNKHGGGEERL